MQEEMQNNVDIQNNEETLKRKVKAVVLASAIFFVFLVTFLIVQSVQIAVNNKDVKKLKEEVAQRESEVAALEKANEDIVKYYEDILRQYGYEPND